MKRTSDRKMAPPASKKAKQSTSGKKAKQSTSGKAEQSTSGKTKPATIQTDIDSPDAKLILYANPDTYELEKYNESEVNLVPDLSVVELHELVKEILFQDNTLIFKKLLIDGPTFSLCAFPPGSGKSTTAKLLKFYLSKNDMHEGIRSWLDNCEFQKYENNCAGAGAVYKFRSSSSFEIMFDLSNVRGETRSVLEKSYALYIIGCWKCAGIPDDLLNCEKELLLTESVGVWSSFSRLRSTIGGFYEGHSYVLLDSLDSMYNLISNLPYNDSKELYAEFTKDITALIRQTDERIKTFCFGVSPYLITEFQSRVFYSIADTNNKVSQYFSFSDASIEKIIREWKLDITKDQCKSVAQFQYNSNTFINPYLCISYLKSLHDKRMYALNISPRSLFQEEDLKILLRVLSSGERGYDCEFTMAVNMQKMCTIPQSLKHRELYYPLFVYRGFLSCVKKDDKIFTLSASNETAKILLKYHLDILFLRKFKFPLKESLNLLDAFLQGNFELFCVGLSKCYTNVSSLMMTDEMKYHCFVAGVFSHLDDEGFDTTHDKERCLIKPDSVMSNGKDVIILNEYKHVKVEKLSKKAQSCNFELKKVVVKRCETIVKDTCSTQIANYASAIAAEYGKNVEVHLILFYNIHIILLHCTYNYNKCEFSQYEIFASKGFYNKQDLNSIKEKCK